MTQLDKHRFKAFLKNYQQEVVVLRLTDDDIAAYKAMMRRWLQRKMVAGVGIEPTSSRL